MSSRNRDTLKNFFSDGVMPTSDMFADLIDQPAFSKRYVEAINELYLPISNIKNTMKNTLNQKIAAEKL